MFISQESTKELEFNRIVEEIQKFSMNDFSKERFKKVIKPQKKEQAIGHLVQTNEYLTSLETLNPIPFSEYPLIFDILEVLHIEDYRLDLDAFLRIRKLSKIVNKLIVFLEKFKDYFPSLHKNLRKVEYTKELIISIDKIFNKLGEIKNDASDNLFEIRNQINEKKRLIAELFSKSLIFCSQNNFLDDIRESFVENQRCLAVKSTFKKRVKGRILGVSKTGSITYILPDSVLNYSNDLIELLEREKHEINQILLDLTDEIAVHYDLLELYQKCVLHFDLIQAKAHYSKSINACLPVISNQKNMNLINAFNPVLFVTNNLENKKTYSQSLNLNKNNRILCISGPNAGGKSITLKTIGILQIMLQSGILVPVHPKSEMFFFDAILTDIGDNQSIENHLSTYSARLKRMSEMIKSSDENTLVLIDEFGTGSDPELGGVLAESFLEFFYEKESFGIITTHYPNIKLKIDYLPCATNAAMLFDEKTLTPMYKLEIGQAGSSFTFEVAQKNNIPYYIIKQAKRKLENQKVNLDKTLIRLQQEKYEIEKSKIKFNEKLIEIEKSNDKIKEAEDKIKKKLFDFQNLYNEEQRFVQFGKKFDMFINEYSNGKQKKDILSSFMKILEQEKYKINKDDKKVEPNIKEKEKLKNEVKNQLKENKKEIIETVNQIKQEKTKNQLEKLKVGLKVKIKGSSAVGTIEKIEKNYIFLNYGTFTTKISIFEVEKI